MAVYKSFIHVERLDTVDTEGILNGICYITPKIDGTNACVYSDGRNVFAGSRSRQLSTEKDNANFHSWVQSNDEQAKDLCNFCLANPHLIVYGEWLGTTKFIGHIKDYNSDALGHLWIFDVYDIEKESYLHDDVWRQYFVGTLQEKYVIPVLSVVKNPSMEQIIDIAENNRFLLDQANHVGEGVVVRNHDYVNCFGRYAVGKFVRNEYKQQKYAKKDIPKDGIEGVIVEAYVTESELSKAKAKTIAYFDLDEFDYKNSKCIGYYLNIICQDCIYAECGNWVKKFRVKEINFAILKALAIQKAKTYIGL